MSRRYPPKTQHTFATVDEHGHERRAEARRARRFGIDDNDAHHDEAPDPSGWVGECAEADE